MKNAQLSRNLLNIVLLLFLFSWNFKSFAAPPVLQTPAAGATGLNRSFTIGIGSVPGAISYDIEISKNGLFTDAAPDYQGQLGGGRSFNVANLSYGTTYTIRWRANNTAYGSTTVTIKNAPALPPAPALYSPVAGATNLNLNFTISIGPATGATSYDIEISKNGLFTDAAPDYQGQLAGTRSFAVTNLSYNTTYTIRWRGNNTAYGTTTITTKKSSAPLLISPAAGATGLDTNFTISIGSATACTNYDIEISKNGLFTDAFPDYQGQLAAGQSFYVANLNYGTTYTIRWRGNNSNYGSTTITTKNAPAPLLISPAAGSTGLDTNFTITIGSSTGATNYDIEISKNGLFTDAFPDYQGQLVAGQSFYVANLSYATTYTIRWRANNSNYGTATVTTKNAPAPPLISPLAGSTGLDTNFTITIGSATGAINYDIEISKNGLFTDAFPDYQGQLAAGQSFYVANLNYNTTYTIRWRANNSDYGSATVTTKPRPASYLSNITDGQYLDTLYVDFMPFYISNALKYEWQFDTTLSFNSSALISATTDNSASSGKYAYDGNQFISGAKYYSRVRVIYTNDTSAYSSGSQIISFYSALHYAVIEAPLDGSVINTNILKLECYVVGGATDYQIEFADNSSFNNSSLYVPNKDFYDPGGWNPVGNIIVKSYDNVHGLSFGTNYYVRARGYNANQPSEFGSSVTFNTGNPKIVVTSPANGATNVNLNHNVSVNQFIYATITNWKAEVSTDPAFTTPLVFTSNTRTIAVSGLAYSTTYYLRVQVKINGIWFISALPVTSYTTKAPPRLGTISDATGTSNLVLPNPFVTDFKIDMDGNENVSVVIQNTLGVSVAEYSGKVSDMNIGSGLKEGVYVITIIDSEGQKYVQRLVKVQN